MADFNSTMVRLMQEVPNRFFFAVPEFQFHYGSIDAIGMMEPWKPFHHFNSTMVRLMQNKTDLTDKAVKYISIPLWFD